MEFVFINDYTGEEKTYGALDEENAWAYMEFCYQTSKHWLVGYYGWKCYQVIEVFDGASAP